MINLDLFFSEGKTLIYEEYLIEKAVVGGFGSIVELTQKARLWLKKKIQGDDCELLITPSGDLLKEEEVMVRKPTSFTFM